MFAMYFHVHKLSLMIPERTGISLKPRFPDTWWGGGAGVSGFLRVRRTLQPSFPGRKHEHENHGSRDVVGCGAGSENEALWPSGPGLQDVAL